MSPKVFAVIVGVVMIVVGMFIGFSSVSATGPGGQQVQCGSGFAVDSDAEAKNLHDDDVDELTGTLSGMQARSGWRTAACDEARSDSSKGTIAWVLIGIGAIAAAGGLLVRPKAQAT